VSGNGGSRRGRRICGHDSSFECESHAGANPDSSIGLPAGDSADSGTSNPLGSSRANIMPGALRNSGRDRAAGLTPRTFATPSHRASTTSPRRPTTHELNLWPPNHKSPPYHHSRLAWTSTIPASPAPKVWFTGATEIEGRTPRRDGKNTDPDIVNLACAGVISATSGRARGTGRVDTLSGCRGQGGWHFSDRGRATCGGPMIKSG